MVSKTCRLPAANIVSLQKTKLTDPLANILSELGDRYNWCIKNAVGASRGILIAVDCHSFEILGSVEGEFTLTVAVGRKLDN